MKFSHATASFVCVAVIAFAAGAAFTEDAPKPKPLSPVEMEQKVQSLSGKCPEHELLAPFVGTWKIAGKANSQMMGEIPFEGEATYASMWDGRFLRVTYEGPGFPPGTKFFGEGHMGFNRLSGKFQSSWMMSMNTNMGFWTGTYDKDKKTFTLTSDMGMPDGTTWKNTQVLVIESKDKMVETHTAQPPGGKAFKTVTMVYTRKPAKPTTGGSK